MPKLILIAMCLLQMVLSYRDNIRCRAVTSTWKKVKLKCLCEPCYLCASKFNKKTFKYSCEPKEGLNLEDDGMQRPPEQPTFDAKEWFLTMQEMTDARNGIPQNGLELYTKDNRVKGYIDGNSMMRDMYHDIEQTGKMSDKDKRDFVYHTGWCANNITFDPYNQMEDTSLATTWMKAARRGVDLLSMVWQNAFTFPNQLDVAPFINDLPKYSTQGARAGMLIDNRLGGLFSTHHQKTVLVKRNHELVSYIGGIDLCYRDGILGNMILKRKCIESSLLRRIWKVREAGWMKRCVFVDLRVRIF